MNSKTSYFSDYYMIQRLTIDKYKATLRSGESKDTNDIIAPLYLAFTSAISIANYSHLGFPEAACQNKTEGSFLKARMEITGKSYGLSDASSQIFPGNSMVVIPRLYVNRSNQNHSVYVLCGNCSIKSKYFARDRLLLQNAIFVSGSTFS